MSVGSGSGQGRQGQQSSAQRAGGNAGPTEHLDAIKEDVSQIAETAVEQGRELLGSAKDQATGYLDQRKDAVAQSVVGLAQSLRDATKEFEDRPNIRAFADNAAQGLEQFAESIRGRSFNEVFSDVEEVVRRRPGAFGAASLAVGFFLARFIKSSAEGIREAESDRRRAQGSQRGGGQRTASQGQRPRAQASPGSSYARGQI